MEPTAAPSPSAPSSAIPLASATDECGRFRILLAATAARQLTPGWGRFMLLSWLFVVASFIAIWVSSRNTGLSTWWLGPETAPRFILVNLLPFVAPSAMCLMCQLALRWLPLLGVVAALATAAIALGDRTRVPGYAVAEFTIAGGALLASLACLAGVLRAKPADETV